MLRFYNGVTLFTLALFYLGPIDWTGAHNLSVAIFVLLCLAAFNITALATYRTDKFDYAPRRAAWTPRSDRSAWVLIVIYGLLTVAHLYSITGRSAFSASSYSLDFGQVYADYTTAANANAHKSSGLGLVIMVAKAVFFPPILLILVERFGRDRWMVLAIMGPMAVSSLLRGTDVELVDIAILLILIAALKGKLATSRLWKYLGLVPVVLGFFLARRIARFGGDLPVCLPDSPACFNYQGPVAHHFGNNAEVLFVFLTNYLTQGYQGLSLAFSLDWTPWFGIGHMSPIKSAVCRGVDLGCSSPDYLSQLTQHGWNTGIHWSTAYTSLANDLSFFLVPLYLAALGIAFAKARAVWRSTGDAGAGASLVLITMFWVFSSANFQLAISLDWAFAAIWLLYRGGFRPVQRRLKTTSAPRASSGGSIVLGTA